MQRQCSKILRDHTTSYKENAMKSCLDKFWTRNFVRFLSSTFMLVDKQL